VVANDPYHYPPELTNLLIDTIPLLCRGKQDVLLFFRGCGVPTRLTADLQAQVTRDRASIGKHTIARKVLTRINEEGDACLRQRREVIRRVTEFEDFSTCWPDDQLKAKGLVGEVRRVVGVRDSFTRMQQERDTERSKYLAQQQRAFEALQKRREQRAQLQRELAALYLETNVYRRGTELESVLNRLCEVEGILVREAFTVTGDRGEGIVEQIDGVIELNGTLYLVEAKWWKEPLGVQETSLHLVRVHGRPPPTGGILISASGFASTVVAQHKIALAQRVVVLCDLREIVLLLERNGDLKSVLKQKVDAAILDRNPLYQPALAMQ
jgi:restriction system protein